MPLLQISNLEKSYGQRTLFHELDFVINPGERVGLIGDNGAGKSTLFRIITGRDRPDSGTVAIPSGTKVGLLEQDPTFLTDDTVMDEAELAFKELHDLAHEMRELEHKMAEPDVDLDAVMERYNTVQHAFEEGGGYDWHHRLESTLLGVGLTKDTWEQKVPSLSGGQRSRLALAKLLINQPDVLLLDEPTNHLDLAAIEWLENYLESYEGASIIISHDRYLLDRLATRIVHLRERKFTSYPGNFTAFLQQKELNDLTRQRAFEAQQKDIEKQSEYIRRFKAGQRARQAKGREKRLTRLMESGDVIQQAEHQHHIHLKFRTDLRAGDRVLKVKDLSKAFDQKKLWQNIGFEVMRGERVGIIGPNGAGKTTLLKCLLGEEDADDGEVTWGASLRIGYYDQRLGMSDIGEDSDLEPDATVYDALGVGRPLNDNQIRSILGMFLFRGDDVDKRLDMLSGGERARVRLAQLLADKPNVLVLDEPTNHLDVTAVAALEGALSTFEGTIITVSHDRHFLDSIPKRLLIITPPDLDDYTPPPAVHVEDPEAPPPPAGPYSAWVQREKQRAADAARAEREKDDRRKQSAPKQQSASKQQPAKPAAAASNPKSAIPNSKSKKDNPYARPFGKLTSEQLEAKIADTEIRLAELQGELADAYRDPQKVKNKQAEIDKLSKELDQLNEEYYGRS
jgi:ATP-binding cassette subfamily F protein 3